MYFMEQVLKMNYYAHTKGNNIADWQLLIDHLTNTANLAQSFGVDAGISDFSYFAGLLHDIGKYSFAFQNRLKGSKHPVDHSTAGAQELHKKFQNSSIYPIALIISYCIAGHHAGLPDYGSPIDLDGTGTLQSRLKTRIEDYSAYSEELDLSTVIIPKKFPIGSAKKHQLFSVAFFTRMIYSTLVDADYQDTEEFIQGRKTRGESEKIDVLCQRFNQFLTKFSKPENKINQIRTQVLHNCIQKATKNPGFFTLTVPTGGGKTYASLAFALNHAFQHGLKRIIYVIPFTSIIEQNASVFRDCLGNENILEQHADFDYENVFKKESNLSDDETNNALEKLKLSAENWDISITVTTNVQFFESLFSCHSSKCRKIHNLAKSVMIFDEAQMLPREFLFPCMNSLWELVNNYHSSVVFCTATQPSLQRFMPDGTKFIEIIEDPQKLFANYQRVQIEYIGKQTDDELIYRLNEQNQSLCIVNTRKHAKGLFNGLTGEGRYHLSTLMCPIHRKLVLNEVRQRLKEGVSCRVISTQVMEAGIDIDFPIGFRAIAGMDSIIQAAGRINREQKHTSGILYVFETDSKFVKRVPAYIEQGAAIARSILREFKNNPISTDAINAYFEKLYSLQEGDQAFDVNGIMACFEKKEGFFFKTASERFHIIDNRTEPVFIPYDHVAEELIEELKVAPFPRTILRKLQLYTVNIYPQELEELYKKGAINLINDRYSVLSIENFIDFYDEKTGLIIPDIQMGNAIFL